MDFRQDMLRDARQWLQHFGFEGEADLDNSTAGLMYFEVLQRIPRQHPRTFGRSSEPLPPLTAEEAQGLLELQTEVETGGPLLPWMSRTLVRQSDAPLIYDWGVHYFHLGTQFEADGFRSRTDNVVFAMVTAERFLVIGIRRHQPVPWAQKDMMRIVRRTWPDVLQPYRVDVGFRPDLLLEDSRTITAVHRNGWAALLSLDGEAFMPPGGGYTTDGGSIEAVRRHDNMASYARELEKQWTALHPGVPARFRLLNDNMALVQDAQGLWGYSQTPQGPALVRLPEAAEQDTLQQLADMGMA